MRLLPIATLAALLLAGCGAPAVDEQDGRFSLGAQQGLFLVDLEEQRAEQIIEEAGLAWMSPQGAFLSWTVADYAIVNDRASGARDVAPQVPWARIHDNGTGLEITPEGARWRDLRTGIAVGNATLPSTPFAGARWTAASDDLSVVAAEYPTGGGACANDIYVRAATNDRTRGCHLRVALDGRVGWTEGPNARIRGRDGAIANVTGENPVFSAQGFLYVDQAAEGPEVLDQDGASLVRADAGLRFALHEVSGNGRFLLLRAFPPR